MDNVSKKAICNFRGKIVRKDLTALMKRGANVPTYVLEYLLGMYCATDDEQVIATGIQKIQKILTENYVHPEESEKIKSLIREKGEYTIIDKISAVLDEYNDCYSASFTNLNIVLEMLASLNVVHKQKDRLIEIAADGKISGEEIDDFIYIQEELERISITVETLQLWSERMLANGIIDTDQYNARKRK